jgi:hypothetical protein
VESKVNERPIVSWIAIDGTLDGAATAIVAVKPCGFAAPLHGCGA